MFYKSRINFLLTCCVAGAALLAGEQANGQSATNIAGQSKVAINGYDPVAFFTQGAPTAGNFKITSMHQGATYFFANEDHKAMFERNPDKYAPQCGGYCAYGVSVGALFPVDINTWQVYQDKLYLNLNSDILNVFNKDIDTNIANANAKWAMLGKPSGGAANQSGHLVNTSGNSQVAINGYDPVAFFTMRKPVNGNFKISSEHHGAKYFFASEENKKMFEAQPDRYAPQCGGFCAFGVSVGALFPVDINTWQVHNDKLYFNLNPQILTMFNGDKDGAIAKADKNWPGLVAKNGGSGMKK